MKLALYYGYKIAMMGMALVFLIDGEIIASAVLYGATLISWSIEFAGESEA